MHGIVRKLVIISVNSIIHSVINISFTNKKIQSWYSIVIPLELFAQLSGD